MSHKKKNGSKENKAKRHVRDKTLQNEVMNVIVVLPIILSIFFLVADFIGLLLKVNNSQHGEAITVGFCIEELVKMVLGYFPVTLISTVAAGLLQQYFYKIPAGFSNEKSVGLFVIFVGYIVFFTVYLCAKYFEYLIVMLAFLAITIGFFVWIWKSLEKEVRDAGPFNKGASHFVGQARK